MQGLVVVMLCLVAGELAWLSLISRKSVLLLQGIQQTLQGGGHPGDTALTNYCVWTFEQDRWRLVEDRSEPGFQIGEPPARAGYPEETVCMPAVRKP